MRALPLRPIVPSKSKKATSGFGVCDIESMNWIEFLIIGYYSKTLEGNEILELFESMEEFCSWIFEPVQPHNIIMAHFGGRFDFSFLLKEYFFKQSEYFISDIIPRGSGLLCFSVSTIKKVSSLPKKFKDRDLIREEKGWFYIKDRTINFRDSSAFLPFSLASITKNFKVEHKKQVIDYDLIKSVTPELREYLIYDLKGLYESVEKYFEWPLIKRVGPAMTIAGQALKVFQSYLTKPIPSLREDIDEFVRGSYFGGRTEIFKPCFEQSNEKIILKTYDVNSLYPHVMLNETFPYKFQFKTKKWLPKRQGFYDVEVEVPKMYIPPLGLVFDPKGWGRLIFPTGSFRGKWSTLELNYAITLGVKITKVYEGVIFEDGKPIFKGYVEDLFAMRKRAGRDSVDNIICKLLLNSLYGRFGLRREREHLEFYRGEEGASTHLEIPVDSSGKRFIRLDSKEIFLEDAFANVAISAWVTSAARIHMHKTYMKDERALFYTDTDSLFTTSSYESNAENLGELKLEYKSSSACFLLPKTYIADTLGPFWTGFDKDGKPVKSSKKIVMKGFDKKKISQFKLEDFYLGLEGELKMLQTTNPKKFATLKTAIKHNEFLWLLDEAPRQIRAKYDKRRLIKDPITKAWDTEALHIEGGVITNFGS